MSNYNDANELASNLVFGTHYFDNSPREQGKPKSLIFTLTRKIIVTADAATHEEWVKVAGEIQDIFDEGFWFKGEGTDEDARALIDAKKDSALDDISDDLEEPGQREVSHGCDSCPECDPGLYKDRNNNTEAVREYYAKGKADGIEELPLDDIEDL